MAVVLVAEDEPSVLGLVSMVLKSAGHEVMAAANGVEAVALYRSYPNQIDLVLTDMKMPVMGGKDVIRLVRQTRPSAKIICMSGYTEDAIPDGVSFLPKPFTPAKLLEAVGEHLKK